MTIARDATLDDLDRLLALFLEMERFYDGDRAVSESDARDRLAQALSGHPAGVVLLVEADDTVPLLGFASFYEMFPGHRLETMWYLKELYVASAARGRGVGEILMQAGAREVLARGGTRIEFTTDGANEAAQRFYARMGAPIMPKVFYRYERADLKRLADADDDD